MTRVQVCVEIAEEHYRLFKSEAKRRGVPVESLVEQCVDELIRELEEEERDGTDVPIITS